MSLDWSTKPGSPARKYADANSTEEPKGSFETGGSFRLAPVTEALIFATMALGIGTITEATAEEVAFRVAYYQRLFGALMNQWDDNGVRERPITTAEVYAHIGLRTNVSLEKRPAWIKRMATALERDIQSAVRHQVQEAAQAEIQVDTLTPVGEHNSL